LEAVRIKRFFIVSRRFLVQRPSISGPYTRTAGLFKETDNRKTELEGLILGLFVSIVLGPRIQNIYA
jgi:hypothetical protein